jgi:hypothetical protein
MKAKARERRGKIHGKSILECNYCAGKLKMLVTVWLIEKKIIGV